jgi:hypothetical protein
VSAAQSFGEAQLGLRWKRIDWAKFRIYVVSNFVRGKFGEPKSAASKKPVVLHSLVMSLLQNWRETTHQLPSRLDCASRALKRVRI